MASVATLTPFVPPHNENVEPARPLRVLAVGAHPDDVEIGCGGALARHRAEGSTVMVVTLSKGAKGGDTVQRERESAEAARRLGADLVHEDLEDASISDGGDTIRIIEDAILAFQPDVVYTHSIHDRHQDHRAVHRATLVAARKVKTVLAYRSPSSTPEFLPNRFVSIDGYVSFKLHLIEAYESQTQKCDYLDPDLLRATARYWGGSTGLKFAEPFELIREIL